MKFATSAATLLALSAGTAVHAEGGLRLPETHERQLLDSTMLNSGLDDLLMMPLTKEKFNLIAHAAVYSKAIYDEASWEAEHGPGSVFITGGNQVDAVGFKSIGHYCFVVYRGTDPDHAADEWMQNLNALTETVNGCKVHNGFHEAATSLDAHTKTWVDACLAEHDGKQLVLTGHSQGAGGAGIGSIMYADYSPLTIGFAQPTFLKEDCSLLNPEHNWRITNTENSDSGIKYDLVAFLRSTFTASAVLGPDIGPLIVLPPNDGESPRNPTIVPLQTSVYVRPASNTEVWQNILNMDSDFKTHSMDTHKDKILAIFSEMRDGGHADTRGFIDGTQCDIDDECQGLCGTDGICGTGAVGESCNLDSDCMSDHCDWSFTCKGKLGLGSSCAEHDTCQSGYCSNQFACSDKSNGSGCNLDSDCNSGRCTWNFICEEKMPSGASCGSVHHNDGDCASGQCSYSWSNGWQCE